MTNMFTPNPTEQLDGIMKETFPWREEQNKLDEYKEARKKKLNKEFEITVSIIKDYLSELDTITRELSSM